MSSETAIPGQTPHQGMSKGAKVALIVVSVVVVLVVIIGGIICAKREALMKVGCNVVVLEVKKQLNENPVEGIDTVAVNKLVDDFMVKLNDSELDLERYGFFFGQIREIIDDKQVDATEAKQFVQSMIDYFPELEETMPSVPVEESDISIDSVDSM
ncbi:MAG: hypothetical protein ABIE70_10065 [bacterium]